MRRRSVRRHQSPVKSMVPVSTSVVPELDFLFFCQIGDCFGANVHDEGSQAQIFEDDVVGQSLGSKHSIEFVNVRGVVDIMVVAHGL